MRKLKCVIVFLGIRIRPLQLLITSSQITTQKQILPNLQQNINQLIKLKKLENLKVLSKIHMNKDSINRGFDKQK